MAMVLLLLMILCLGKDMDVEVNRGDMGMLLEDHNNELSIEKHEKLKNQHQKAIVEEMSLEEEDGRADVPSFLICKNCATWDELQICGMTPP